jgi:hypothetical protein
VRYYEWLAYSNRARGERAKHETEPGAPEATDVDVIDVSGVPPATHPVEKVAGADQVEDPGPKASGKVWEVDPLICPCCSPDYLCR